MRFSKPTYINYFGEGFNGLLDKLPEVKNPTMSYESDHDMQFVDDPTLFEFKQNNECENFDMYESIPAPMEW